MKLFLKNIVFAISIICTESFARDCIPFPLNGVHKDSNHKVEHYTTEFQQCSFNGTFFYTTRSFILNRSRVYLAVDGQNLSSQIIDGACLHSCEDIDEQTFKYSLYGQLLDESGSFPYPLQNDGITSGHGNKVALTIDMCPSSRGLSTKVYDVLVKRANSKNRAIPVGIAMTRAWKNRWPNKFATIKNYHAQGLLHVEWINHSSNHAYKRGAPFSQNFLLIPGTNIEDEVLGNEIALIESGVTPSSFFRFPGLVSNQNLMRYVTDHGLIVLGSKAWLAKNEVPDFGSIILIHGNKNEPIGEDKLFRYINTMDSKGHEFGHLDEVLQ